MDGPRRERVVRDSTPNRRARIRGLRVRLRACYRARVLLAETSPDWIALALARFDEVLVDHAHCEKKAAAHALSLLVAFPELAGLPRAMARLAREEAGHLGQVLAILEKRGLSLGRDTGDPYAQALQKLVRTPHKERLLDRLLISALIEERSRERLDLLARHLPDPALRDFYARLADAEAGHGSLFLRLARKAAPQELEARLAVLAREEARLVRELPVRAAIH
jgi:tRNA-(ms[2]io[6]A)-hydroxylase